MEKINWSVEIASMGLPQDKYLAVRLSSFYHYGIKKGMSSDAALSYAKERLKYNLERTNKEKPVSSLNEDEILDSRLGIMKAKVASLIYKKLRELVGNVDDAEFKKVIELFKRQKNQSLLTNREALEEVSRMIGKHREFAKRQEKREEPIVEKEHSDFDISKDFELYDFVRSIDPKYADSNLVLFKRYRGQGYRVESALDKIRKVGILREFCRENNIPLTLASRTIDFYPNIEDVKRVLLEREDSKFGLNSEVLLPSKSDNINDNPIVNYNGEKIRLKRLINYLFKDRLNGHEFSVMYTSVFDNHFIHGKSLDEAMEFGIKTIKMYRSNNIFREEFPSDPNYARRVFEEHYITDGNSFEEALEKTRKEIRSNVSKHIRLAMNMDRLGYFKLSDIYFNYLNGIK
jgi:hypothetical protein